MSIVEKGYAGPLAIVQKQPDYCLNQRIREKTCLCCSCYSDFHIHMIQMCIHSTLVSHSRMMYHRQCLGHWWRWPMAYGDMLRQSKWTKERELDDNPRRESLTIPSNILGTRHPDKRGMLHKVLFICNSHTDNPLLPYAHLFRYYYLPQNITHVRQVAYALASC